MEPLQAAQQTFFAESRELLSAMEDALLQLEKNARCAGCPKRRLSRRTYH